MPSTEVLIAFIMATAVFAYMPGPALLYTAAQTVARGRRAGWLAVLGLHIGGYVHVFAAGLGLAILFTTVPVLYLVLKFVGAGYLIYLGTRMFLGRGHGGDDTPQISHRTPRRAFWESVTVEALNPKTALFFLAFLPQFTDPAASLPLWAQLLVLGTIVNVTFSSADVICVLLADKLARLLRESRRGACAMQRVGGGILVALGLNLALNRS